jgi:hypothetical protein
MNLKSTTHTFIIAALILFVSLANADTLYLKNGTTISGKIKKVGKTDVVITSIIGELAVDSLSIARVEWQTSELPVSGNCKNIFQLLWDTGENIESKIENSYSKMHLQEQNGFGLSFFKDERISDVNLFYDRNLSTHEQIHLEYSFRTYEPNRVLPYLGEEIGNNTYLSSNTKTHKLLLTYRHFVFANRGFFIGFGAGLVHSNYSLNSISIFNQATNEYTSIRSNFRSNLNGIYGLGEIGWQGKEGVYFNVGYKPAVYLYSDDNFNVGNTPNVSNYQDAISGTHERQKSLDQFSVGLGWFF